MVAIFGPVLMQGMRLLWHLLISEAARPRRCQLTANRLPMNQLPQELVDRATLTHMYCASVRYGKELPTLIIRE